LTQEALAESSGLSVRTIRGLETGRRSNPQLASLLQLADALDLALDERHELLAAFGLTDTPSPAAYVRALPRQLPADPRGFAGRARELAALERAAGDEGTIALITAIAGAGGIGKTWLALHWAHTHADRFPDGHLFVDLRGFSPDSAPLDPLTAVRGFLDALGVDPARITGGLAEHAAEYRSQVAGKRMLIVLDNAASTDQVVPLLPGTPTCTVLITSRKALSGLLHRYGAHHLPLDALDENEAQALFARRLGDARLAAEPEATAELILSCGRYPLALAIMAGRAHTHPDIPLTEFAAELRESGIAALDDTDPAASLPTVLSWSLRTLTMEHRTVFGLLGIAPGADIGLPAAASLTALPLARAKKVLRELEEASLLSRGARDRYSMHDLIRGYATATAHHDIPKDTREAALRRLLDFYVHTAHTASRVLEPNRPLIQLDTPLPGTQRHPLPADPVAMAWFDAEHANLLAAQRAAAGDGRHTIVWQLAWPLTTFHTRRGYHHDELAVWRAAVDAAAHLRDPAIRARIHRQLGGAYSLVDCHELAIEHLHQALALAECAGDRRDQGHIHQSLGRAWERRGDDRQALGHAIQALEHFRATGRPALEAGGHTLVGWCRARLGDYDTARVHCQAALRLNDHFSPTLDAANQDSLGYIAHHTGRHHVAVQHYQQAITLFRSLNHVYETANTLDNLGHPLAAIGQDDAARAAWHAALELYRQQKRTHDADRVKRQLETLGHDSCE
jgi:tetratricopeptide (TPR) repeat protein